MDGDPAFCRRLIPPAAASIPKALVNIRIVCQDCLASPREIVIEQFPFELGRGLGVNLRIDDRWLSRRHCRLELCGNDLMVRDLGSRHGTFVNGQRFTECRLNSGDRLTIGLSHFEIEIAEPDGSAASAALAPAAIPA